MRAGRPVQRASTLPGYCCRRAFVNSVSSYPKRLTASLAGRCDSANRCAGRLKFWLSSQSSPPPRCITEYKIVSLLVKLIQRRSRALSADCQSTAARSLPRARQGEQGNRLACGGDTRTVRAQHTSSDMTYNFVLLILPSDCVSTLGAGRGDGLSRIARDYSPSWAPRIRLTVVLHA